MPLKDKVKRREYHRLYLNRRYAEDLEYRTKHRARTDRNDEKYNQERKLILFEFRENGCFFCDEKDQCCLSAHHLDPKVKDFGIGTAIGNKISPKKLLAELQKCICVCENCHRKIHAGKLTVNL